MKITCWKPQQGSNVFALEISPFTEKLEQVKLVFGGVGDSYIYPPNQKIHKHK